MLRNKCLKGSLISLRACKRSQQKRTHGSRERYFHCIPLRQCLKTCLSRNMAKIRHPLGNAVLFRRNSGILSKFLNGTHVCAAAPAHAPKRSSLNRKTGESEGGERHDLGTNRATPEPIRAKA